MDVNGLKVALYRRLPRRLQIEAVRLSTPNFTVGSLGLITYDGQHVLLVRQSYRKGWSPPGGLLQRGETPTQGVAREVQEEIGLVVDFAPSHRAALDVGRQTVSFLSAGLIDADAVFAPRGPEILEARWFPVNALPAMPFDYSEGMPAEDFDALRQVAGVRP